MACDLLSYDQFWRHYLRAHRNPANRGLHYAGSLGAIGLAIFGVLVEPWLLVAAPVFGYGLAWIGHFRFERNKPATFGHPFWSLVSDFRMLALWLTRRLDPELRRADVK